MQAVLKAQINKTTARCARYRADDAGWALSSRACEDVAQSESDAADPSQAAAENDLRTLRNFGLKEGMVGTVKFEARIRELVANLPDLAALIGRCSLSSRCYAKNGSERHLNSF